MQLGLIGLPLVGKTTLFELLAESRTSGAGRTHQAVVRIPDPRVDFLSELFHPRKTTYAQLEIVDIPGLVPGSDRGAAAFLAAVRGADALVHVVRVFEDEQVPHVEGSVDPLRDIELINYELLLADLDLVEKRLERMQAGKKKKGSGEEQVLLERLRSALEAEQPISTLSFSEQERAMMSAYQFLTTKPLVLVLNVGEEHLRSRSFPGQEGITEYARSHGMPLLVVSARLEAEIAELEGEERALFMQEAGIDEPGVVRLARTVYQCLGLISFFTVGEDEVKAWTIPAGTPARRAAGKIHSDIERGFIRAEVVNYQDMVTYRSMARIKEQGLFRLEGKDYVIQDGEIVHFRFNV
ncbi:MAG: redox-regulated ATPase YchF [Syntrophomonadaceae bacterium]|nr:redox-regulated ATPase YchF [Syntrophomonadaceae bacterium]MDH7497639.1 redox-regulated ATPase YchF [Syntrophomonadaceae bacterium]